MVTTKGKTTAANAEIDKTETTANTTLNGNLLVISAEEFQKGYDFNIAGYLEEGYQGAYDYIAWHRVDILMRQLFPNYRFLLEKPQIVNSISREGIEYQTGTVLNGCILDTVTGKTTLNTRLPVMGNGKSNPAVLNPNSREITDAEQRLMVKTVATQLGLGYRVWTREGIDLDGANKAHPKFRFLQKIARMEVDLKDKELLPDGYIAPTFGDSVVDIKAIGKMLADIQQESIEIFDTWKTPNDAINWASRELDKPVAEVTNILTSISAEKGRKNENFYNKVMELKEGK